MVIDETKLCGHDVAAASLLAEGTPFLLQQECPWKHSCNTPTLHHSHPNKTTVNPRKFQWASQSETWQASSACFSLRHLTCAKNSHFLAISTEAGYLFLLTAPALNIKSQVPPHVSCPDHNPRHQAIPLAPPQVLNKGKASACKQTPNTPFSPSFSLFLSFSNVPLTGPTASELLCFFPVFLSVCLQSAWIAPCGWDLDVFPSSSIRYSQPGKRYQYRKTISLNSEHSDGALVPQSLQCAGWEVCESLGDEWRAERRGEELLGDAAEHQMTDVQMCVCGAFLPGRKKEGWWW